MRSFKVSISVDPKFHPKIIGRKGAVISQIRKDHDVNVQFPDKGDEQQDVIVISGYERNTEEARSAIELLVSTLQEMVSHDVHLDPRTHARIIGARGKAIRKTMEEFKVRAWGGGVIEPQGKLRCHRDARHRSTSLFSFSVAVPLGVRLLSPLF